MQDVFSAYETGSAMPVTWWDVPMTWWDMPRTNQGHAYDKIYWDFSCQSSFAGSVFVQSHCYKGYGSWELGLKIRPQQEEKGLLLPALFLPCLLKRRTPGRSAECRVETAIARCQSGVSPHARTHRSPRRCRDRL